MATVLAEQAKAAGVTITLKTVPPGTFFGPDYLNWTFSQDYYSYFPYLAQAAQSMLPASPYNETHNHDPRYTQLYHQANATASAGLHQELLHDMQHSTSPGRLHHPRVHRHARRLQHQDRRDSRPPGSGSPCPTTTWSTGTSPECFASMPDAGKRNAAASRPAASRIIRR